MILPSGERFNQDFFINEVFERYDKHRSEPRAQNRSYRTLLHIDNTPLHLVHSKFDPFGIHRLPHPHHGPDITPCDFWLFGYLKMKLGEMFFNIPAVVLTEVEEILGDISITGWAKAFDQWKGCLKGSIDGEGEYLENNNLMLTFCSQQNIFYRALSLTAPLHHGQCMGHGTAFQIPH
jgi:hypothetical protein